MCPVVYWTWGWWPTDTSNSTYSQLNSLPFPLNLPSLLYFERPQRPIQSLNMETLDFSIFFRQNSLESISDRFFEYVLLSASPALSLKSTFIYSPMMGIYFLLALHQQLCSVLGFEGEQDMMLVHKEHLCMWGWGRRQKQRITRTCEMFHIHHPSSRCQKDPDHSLPFFFPS